MNYETTLVTSPTGEPIHLDHAKLHCSVTDTDRDKLFPEWIAQAREGAESGTGRQLIHARYALTLDGFLRYPFDCYGIVIPHSPLVRVVSVQYLDLLGATQTVAAADYVVNSAKVPSRIVPAYLKYWPQTLPDPAAVTVTYDAGYASPFTADATANTITVSGPVTFAVDDPVRFTNSGGATASLPAGLSAGTNYYIKTAPGSGVYTLAATIGGATVDLTTAGSGLNLVGEIPSGLMSWMLLQIEQSLRIRGATEVVDRGEVRAMPFVDGYLMRHKVWLP